MTPRKKNKNKRNLYFKAIRATVVAVYYVWTCDVIVLSNYEKISEKIPRSLEKVSQMLCKNGNITVNLPQTQIKF